MDSKHVAALGESNMAWLMFKYSAPTIVATLIDAAYNIVDRMFLGRYCGEDALAAVTVCFTPTLVFLAVGMTIGVGSATIVSIKLGEKDRDGAERVLGQAFFLFSVFCALLAAVAIPFMRPMMMFFGATEKIVGLASSYYTIIIAGLIFEKISFGINSLIRAEGRPIYAMSTIAVGGIVNGVLDYVFIAKFGWGVHGAAAATIIAEACASVFVLVYYFGGYGYLRIRLKHLRVHFDLIKSILSAGSPSFVIQTLAAIAIGLIIVQARAYGSESAIAVFGVAQAVTTLMFLPIVGVSVGMQPVIGFNWGAGNMDRVRSALFKTLGVATAMCMCSFLIAQFLPVWIFRGFLGSASPLIETGAHALRTITLGYPLIGFNIIISGYFQSTKRPAYSIFVTVLRQLIFLLPSLYFLPPMFGLTGVWAAFPIADTMGFAAALFIFLLELPRLREVRLIDAGNADKLGS